MLRLWLIAVIVFAAAASALRAGAAPGSEFERRREAHWAWQPVRQQTPPNVSHVEWANDPIDRFILAKLEQKGLDPAPAADRRALIRRLSFALVGLPPTPQEVEAFVGDTSGGAFEKVVDRL